MAVMLNANHLFYTYLRIIDYRDKFVIYRYLSHQKGAHDFSWDNGSVGGLFWLICNEQLK